jgi:hypothetical protein
VVIYYLHVVSVFTLPTKANTPSIIDADAVLSRPIPDKLLKPGSGRRPQIIQGLGRIQEQ